MSLRHQEQRSDIVPAHPIREYAFYIVNALRDELVDVGKILINVVIDLDNIHIIFVQHLYIFSETILPVNIAKVISYFIFGFGEMQNQVRSDAAESAYNHTAFVRIQFFIQRFILLIVKTAFLPIHTNQKRFCQSTPIRNAIMVQRRV